MQVDIYADYLEGLAKIYSWDPNIKASSCLQVGQTWVEEVVDCDGEFLFNLLQDQCLEVIHNDTVDNTVDT